MKDAPAEEANLAESLKERPEQIPNDDEFVTTGSSFVCGFSWHSTRRLCRYRCKSTSIARTLILLMFAKEIAEVSGTPVVDQPKFPEFIHAEIDLFNGSSLRFRPAFSE
jgi:hypothetical protein